MGGILFCICLGLLFRFGNYDFIGKICSIGLTVNVMKKASQTDLLG